MVMHEEPDGYKSSTSLASPSPSLYSQSSPSQSLSPSFMGMGSSQLVDRTLSHPLLSGPIKFLSAHTNDPVVRWAQKHSDAPFTAGRKWIVEHFQFGSCMFDYPGLKDRYTRLVGWTGLWVNYWTETVPKRKGDGAVVVEEGNEKEKVEARDKANDAALMEMGLVRSSSPAPPADVTSRQPPETLDAKVMQKVEKARLKQEKTAEKALKKQREVELKAKKIAHPRHFIVLPTGLGRRLGGSDKWEVVTIGGVQDEVAAHCGLFIRGHNLDYDGLVESVGQRVLAWCRTI
jgi:hypothetical protein